MRLTRETKNSRWGLNLKDETVKWIIRKAWQKIWAAGMLAYVLISAYLQR